MYVLHEYFNRMCMYVYGFKFIYIYIILTKVYFITSFGLSYFTTFCRMNKKNIKFVRPYKLNRFYGFRRVKMSVYYRNGIQTL